MDLRPFERIVVCGMSDVEVTHLRDEISSATVPDSATVGEELADRIFSSP